MIQRLISVFRMKHDYTDPFERLRARGLWRIAWALLFLSIGLWLYLPFSPFASETSVSSILLILYAISICAVVVMLNRGNAVAASLIFIIGLFVTTVALYVVFHVNPLLLITFSMPIIAAGVLLNRRGMFVMIGLTIAALTIAALMDELGVLTTPEPEVTPFINLLVGAISVGVDGIFLIVFAGGQYALLRRNSDLAKDLRSSATISQSIAAIQATDELLNKTVSLIRDHMDYYHVHIFLVEDQTRLLVLRAGTAFGSDEFPQQQRRITPDDPGVINRAVQTGAVQMISFSDAAVRRVEMLAGMQSQLVLPLRRGDKVLGVLDIQDIDTRPFNEEAVEVLQAIASQLSIAVENARRFGDLQQASDERQRLTEELHAASMEIDQLNQEVTERVWTRYLAGRGETVIGYDWRQGTLLPATQPYPGMERTVNARQPELYIENDEHILSVPIISRGQLLGAMEFRAPSNRVWNKRSLELARVISQRLALALDNVRLFEQAQIIATREQLANQIAANLQSKTDIDTLVNVAAETFQQALGASRTNIRLGFPEQTAAKPQATVQNGRNGSH